MLGTGRSSPWARCGSSARVDARERAYRLDRLGREAATVTGAPEQLGVRRVQRLVALDRGIAQQRIEQLKAGLRPVGEPDGSGVVGLDHGRRADRAESSL
jgi:hypothetical protein